MPLPANPNAVVFAAPASVVFDRRSWSKILELARGPLMSLHLVCELPVLAGYGWRVGLDRKNRRTLNLTLYFAVDGAVSPEHLDGLDRAMAHNPIRWSTSHIERIPANGVAALLARDGEAHLVCTADANPSVRCITLEDGAVAVTETDASPIAETLDMDLVVGTSAPYSDVDREMERMRLAFAHTFALRIVEADGVVHAGEERFMLEVFRPEVMERLGLTDPKALAANLERALAELPERLGYHDKLALIGLFFSACYSDGTVDAREMRVLKDAADALGVERERVVNYLQRFW